MASDYTLQLYTKQKIEIQRTSTGLGSFYYMDGRPPSNFGNKFLLTKVFAPDSTTITTVAPSSLWDAITAATSIRDFVLYFDRNPRFFWPPYWYDWWDLVPAAAYSWACANWPSLGNCYKV